MISLEFAVPLAKHSGEVKVGGVKIGQADLKEKWSSLGTTRSPVFCSACSAEHHIVMGTKEKLRLGAPGGDDA